MPAHKCDFSGLFMGIQIMWHCPPRKNYKYSVKSVCCTEKGQFCSQPSLKPKSAMSTIDILGLGCVTSIYSPLMPSPVDIGRLHFEGTKGDNKY